MSEGLRIDAQSLREEVFEQLHVLQWPEAEERQRALESLSDAEINDIILDIRDDYFWESFGELVRQAINAVETAVEKEQ